MSFEPILREMMEGCRGVLGVALLGSDGIAIEQVVADAGEAALDADAIGAAGAEFGRILDEMRKAADAIGGGAVEEASVRLARFDVQLHVVDEDVFLALVLSADAIPGKARYLARRQLAALRELL